MNSAPISSYSSCIEPASNASDSDKEPSVFFGISKEAKIITKSIPATPSKYLSNKSNEILNHESSTISTNIISSNNLNHTNEISNSRANIDSNNTNNDNLRKTISTTNDTSITSLPSSSTLPPQPPQMIVTKPGVRECGVRTKITIDTIDDVNEEIQFEVEICLHFEDSSFIQEKNLLQPDGPPIGGPYHIIDPADSGIFVPVFEFKNIRSKEHIGGFKFLVSKKTGIIYLFRTYRLVTREILDLQQFPYDRQLFQLKFESFTVKFVSWSAPEFDMPIGIKKDPLWLHNATVVQYDGSTWALNWTNGVLTNESGAYQSTTKMAFTRTATYYLFNFVLFIFVLVEASITTIAIPPSDFGGRSGISFTLLLTIIAFRFVMVSVVPQVDYLTLLDKYNFIAVLMLMLVILENFFFSTYFFPLTPDGEQNEEALSVDKWFALAFTLFWFLLHILLYMATYFNIFAKPWDRVEADKNKCDVIQRAGGSFYDSMVTK